MCEYDDRNENENQSEILFVCVNLEPLPTYKI